MMMGLALALLVIASIFVTVELNHAFAEGKLLPKDEPNFKPTITKIVENGRNLEIIEFKSKLAQ
jgi:hypothetical protein